MSEVSTEEAVMYMAIGFMVIVGIWLIALTWLVLKRSKEPQKEPEKEEKPKEEKEEEQEESESEEDSAKDATEMLEDLVKEDQD